MAKRLVIVEWCDPVVQHGWIGDAEARELKPIPSRTVGWLLGNDGDVVVLASSTNQDGDWGEVHAIPMAVVTTIETVRDGTGNSENWPGRCMPDRHIGGVGNAAQGTDA